MERCPTCGARLWPKVEHQRVHKDLPEFATALWVCRSCGWSGEDPKSTGKPDRRAAE